MYHAIGAEWSRCFLNSCYPAIVTVITGSAVLWPTALMSWPAVRTALFNSTKSPSAALSGNTSQSRVCLCHVIAVLKCFRFFRRQLIAGLSAYRSNGLAWRRYCELYVYMSYHCHVECCCDVVICHITVMLNAAVMSLLLQQRHHSSSSDGGSSSRCCDYYYYYYYYYYY